MLITLLIKQQRLWKRCVYFLAKKVKNAEKKVNKWVFFGYNKRDLLIWGRLPFMNKRIGMLISMLLLPCLLVCLVEYLAGNTIANMTGAAFFLNVLFCQLLIVFIFAITCNYRLALIGGSGIIYIFGLVNHFVQAFRGTPFLPADILSVGTAADVVGSYPVGLNKPIILTLAILIFALAVCSRLQYRSHWRNKQQRLLSCCLLVLIGVAGFYHYQPAVWQKYGVEVKFWNQLQGYQENGAFLSFVLNSKYLVPQAPEGYTSTKAAELWAEKEQQDKQPQSVDQEKPHIIMVMNESYADLSVLGELQTSEPYLESYANLRENVTKGNLYVSVLGGGTCNSEFEALTGYSMAFLPPGVMPYQQYIKEEQFSLATVLKSQGYETIAFHPGKADSWCREQVYPLLGFERFVTKKDMAEVQLMRDAYADDSCNYRELIRLYEQRGEKKLFLFNVTIQNHGGYQLQAPDLPHQVKVVGEGNYPQAEQYLSLMKSSDEALAELLAYFAQEEEPVLLVFFGDHQPILEAELTENLLGAKLSDLTVEQVQQRYQCPFFIWTNYASDSAWIEAMSVNYLPALILEKAGIEQPAYYEFLRDLFAEIPVINSVGYIDKEGNHYANDNSNTWPQELNEYALLQYSLLFDRER